MARTKYDLKIFNDKVTAARGRWQSTCKRWEDLDRHTATFVFAVFLGDPYDGLRPFIVNPHNPDVVNKIELILGDNGVAILKMMEAKFMDGKNGQGSR